MKFADIHCHIMPGVDDGSKDPQMSLNMMRIAADNGIDTIILTPHNKIQYRCASPDGIRRRTALLQEISDKARLGLLIYPGNELMYDRSLPERLGNGQALTLADSRYALVEFDPNDRFVDIQDGLRAVSYEGFTPILAHIERYPNMLGHVDYAEQLVRSGVLIQVNASDVEQKMMRPDTKFVNALLKEELVSFVATDAHRDEGRAPYLSAEAGYLYHKYHEDYVDSILRWNALAVINNETISV